MRMNLTARLVCVIVSLLFYTRANASIISRGFLENTLTAYETSNEINLKLDNKVNINDFDLLTARIGNLKSDSIAYNWLKIPYEYHKQSALPSTGLVVPDTISDRLDWLINGSENDGGPLEYMFNLLLHGEFNINNAIYGNDQSYLDPYAQDYTLGINHLTQMTFAMYEFLDSLNKTLRFPIYEDRCALCILGGANIEDDAIILNAYYITDYLGDLWHILYGAVDGILYGYSYDNKYFDGLMGLNNKIGSLPSDYDNVGDALNAIKSNIDAKNLPSDYDDGQYVLTAKKVGNAVTYTWVRMDTTDEEQSKQAVKPNLQCVYVARTNIII